MNEYDPRATPWQLHDSDFYEIDSRTTQLEFLIRYAVLAPSGHNTQPWSFKIVDEGIEVYGDFTRRLPVTDASDRELVMSVGAAITNLRVAAAHFGFETSVLYERRPEENAPLALVSVRETCDPDRALASLFPAITARRTNRQSFDGRSLDEAALAKLCDFIDEQADAVEFILPHDRPRTADLIAEGDRLLMGNDSFRQELAAWVRPNETSEGDGICGDAFGIPGPISAMGAWFVRSVDYGPAQAKRDRDLAEKAAGLLVLTADDDRVSLLRAGETLERLLLLLTTLGVQYSFLNQPIEVNTLRGELWSMIRTAKPPQLLLRIGYAEPVRRPMPRRAVEKVLAK